MALVESVMRYLILFAVLAGCAKVVPYRPAPAADAAQAIGLPADATPIALPASATAAP